MRFSNRNMAHVLQTPNIWRICITVIVINSIRAGVTAFPLTYNATKQPYPVGGSDDDLDVLTLNDKITIGFTVPGVIATVAGIWVAVYRFLCNPEKPDEEPPDSVEMTKTQDILKQKVHDLQQDMAAEKIRYREDKIKELQSQKEQQQIQSLLRTAKEFLDDRRKLSNLARQMSQLGVTDDEEEELALKQVTNNCQDVERLEEQCQILNNHVSGEDQISDSEIACVTHTILDALGGVNKINDSMKQQLVSIGIKSDQNELDIEKQWKRKLEEQEHKFKEQERIINECNEYEIEILKKTLSEEQKSNLRLLEQVKKLEAEVDKLSQENQKLQNEQNNIFKDADERDLFATAKELHRYISLFQIITNEIVREVYHNVHLKNMMSRIQSYAKTFHDAPQNVSDVEKKDNDEPTLSFLLTSTAARARNILLSFSRGLKWQNSNRESFVTNDQHQIQGIFYYKDALAIFTAMNRDSNSVKILPIDSNNDSTLPPTIQLATPRWNDSFPVDMAATDNTILVVGDGKRYIYEFPCQDSNQELKRVKVLPHDNQSMTLCIDIDRAKETIIVGITYGGITTGAVVMTVPDFTQQYVFDFRNVGVPLGFDFTNDLHLHSLVYTKRSVTVSCSEWKSVSNIQAPTGYAINCALFGPSDYANEILIAAKRGAACAVFRYVWDESKQDFAHAEKVSDNITFFGLRCLKRLTDGSLANVENQNKVKFYQLV